MATTTRYPIRIPLRLPRPIEPTESPASKPHRPQTPNLPPTLHTSAPCFRSNHRQPTRSNLHSLNSWPAVQCNEGFCNAPQSQCFTLTMTTASQKPHHSANPGGHNALNSVPEVLLRHGKRVHVFCPRRRLR